MVIGWAAPTPVCQEGEEHRGRRHRPAGGCRQRHSRR